MSTEIIAHLAGDYVVQSDWQAGTKTKRLFPAAVHASSYAACFLPLTRDWRALAVIGGTHFAIDHWRLAKYLVWAKNQLAPEQWRYALDQAGAHGYPVDKPPHLADWLLFLADNTTHLAINHWALGRWSR